MADQNQQPKNNDKNISDSQSPTDMNTTPPAESADGVSARPHFTAEGIEFNPNTPIPDDAQVNAAIDQTTSEALQEPTQQQTQTDQPLQPPKEPEEPAADVVVDKPPIMHSMQMDSGRVLKEETTPEKKDGVKVEEEKGEEKTDEIPSEAPDTQSTPPERPGAARPPVKPTQTQTIQPVEEEKPEIDTPPIAQPKTPQVLPSKTPNTTPTKTPPEVDKKATANLGNLDALRARVSALSTERPEGDDVVFDAPTPPPGDTKKEVRVGDIEQAQQQATDTVSGAIGEQEGKEAKAGALKKIKEAKDSLVSPLRTYKEDVAKALKSKDTSYVGIVAKEQEKRAKKQEQKVERRRGTLLYIIGAILSGLLVIGGVSALIYVFVIDDGVPTTVPPEEIPTLVFVDEQNEVDVTNLGRRSFLRIITNEKDAVDGSLGSVEQLYLVKEVGGLETEPRKVLLTSREFFDGIEARVPGSFSRALGTDMTLAAHVFDGNQAVLLVDISFYENAFAGMLDWERFMNQDLAPLFGPEVDLVADTATSSPLSRIPFRDEVIRNKEVRVLRNKTGQAILLYSFIDRETLLITTNESSFNEIISRITTTRI